MRTLKLLLPVVLVVCVSVVQADTILVPSQQPTIQAGINAAVDGDTVLVADGIYTGNGNRDIIFLGKAIVVMSGNGPENCIIDCQGDSLNPHRGFFFNNLEENSSVVQGFTIQNGWMDLGGGIYCYNSSPTITGNIIKHNTASKNIDGGGGIYVYNGSLMITGNTIKENVTRQKYCTGGGIMYNGGSPTIAGNTITGNTAYGGGGIRCRNSHPTIEGNSITGNTADVNGGGIYLDYSSPIVSGNTIAGNTAAAGSGGGIFDQASAPSVITGNMITGNTAGNLYFGGGILCWLSSSIIEDNTISGNTVDYGAGITIHTSFVVINNNTVTNNAANICGGGFEFYYGSATMANNTIVDNYAVQSGGGIHCMDSCMVTITDAILWNNDAPIGDEIYIGYYGLPPDPSTLTILYSDVEGGLESVVVDEECILNWGDGMIDEDPMFVLPDKHDCRLLWQSPCIDTGHPDSLDADGTRSDMGAHYFNQNDFLTLYLTPDATEVLPGDDFGVTYTAINRWDSPEVFWVLSQVFLPRGFWYDILGPDKYTLPANYTAQVHITHPVPNLTPTGIYIYRSLMGMPPGTLYDSDSFTFRVTE